MCMKLTVCTVDFQLSGCGMRVWPGQVHVTVFRSFPCQCHEAAMAWLVYFVSFSHFCTLFVTKCKVQYFKLVWLYARLYFTMNYWLAKLVN